MLRFGRHRMDGCGRLVLPQLGRTARCQTRSVALPVSWKITPVPIVASIAPRLPFDS
jgi:hypothetical protein